MWVRPGVASYLLAGQHEAAPVRPDIVRQPGGARHGPDEREHAGYGQVALLAGDVIRQLDPVHRLLTVYSRYLGVGQHLDVGRLGDALQQVVRHGPRRVVAPHDEVDPRHPLRHVDGSLPRRVARPHHGHLTAGAHLGLDGRGGVVHAGAVEALASWDLELTVIGAAGYQQRLGGDVLAAGQLQHLELGP